MSGHRIIVTLGRMGMVEWQARCDEPEGATCRLTCPEDCESWTVQHDDEGAFHHQSQFDFFEKESVGPGPRHRLVDSGACTVCDWLNADQSLIPELFGGRGALVLANLEIVPRWEDSDTGYTWVSRAESTKRWTGDTEGKDAWMGEPR